MPITLAFICFHGSTLNNLYTVAGIIHSFSISTVTTGCLQDTAAMADIYLTVSEHHADTAQENTRYSCTTTFNVHNASKLE
jgi:hypothetical protein